MKTALHPVRRVVPLAGGCHVVEVEGPIPPTAPGQFFMLRPRDEWACLLPRPFSLFERGADGSWGGFLLKEVGPATRHFARLAAGTELWLTGPLGNRFPAPAPGVTPVCVAGGVGLAPFLLVLQERQQLGLSPAPLMFGARSAAGLAGRERFDPGCVAWRIATEDGSEGTRGLVTDLLVTAERAGELGPRTPVLCCGPDPMMHAVARFCDQRGIPCWLSLETYMGCGYGVCNGCSVHVTGERFHGWPYAKTCMEGPVFRTTELVAE